MIVSRPPNPAFTAARAREPAPPPPAAAVSDAQRLDELASRLNRCGFSNADPERFHVERNAIVVEMRAVAKRLRGEGARREHVWRAPAR